MVTDSSDAYTEKPFGSLGVMFASETGPGSFKYDCFPCCVDNPSKGV